MKTINFKEETEFRSQEKLRNVSGIQEIYFDKSTVVIFKGKISLNEGIHFSGICRISKDVIIDKGCNLKNVVIGEECNIRSYSVLNDCLFGKKNIIGPFCFVRNETSVGDRCIVGSHVEVTRSKISNEVKISHQAFIGDATIGNKVIIGAGVVFCNYDGSNKQSSNVADGSIIGSGTMIVSPVEIGAMAVIGAGSVITKNIDNGERFIQSRLK